ncbi:YdeI/OmpD-associated family protein [Paenibacillus alginolyticus]|uniref:YdeI/OmpD-associated family protein n=1 Tax=Paenibacillus alginolyticus TaxID=59839 RepID=UPI0034DAED64
MRRLGRGNDEARHYFEQMSYSSRKEYCDWIESAKKAVTRVARIEKAVDKLSAGQRLK